MKKITHVILFLFAIQVCVAQTDSAKKSPLYKIKLSTMNDNLMAGILIGSTDSSVTVYPGTIDHYKKGKQFSNATLNYENIKEISAKRKGGAFRGALIGAGVGMLPVIVSLFQQGKGNTGYLGVITVPVGAISGAVIGAVSKKKARINGDKEKLKQFLTKID